MSASQSNMPSVHDGATSATGAEAVDPHAASRLATPGNHHLMRRLYHPPEGAFRNESVGDRVAAVERWGVVLLRVSVLALCGCGGTPGPAREPVAEAVVPSEAPTDDAARPPGAVVQLVPATRPVRPVDEAEDGTRSFLVGGARVVVRGAEAEVSLDRTAGLLVGASRVADGWVFAAADGLFLRADSFLGPLRRIGQVRAPVRRAAQSNGRLAVLDAQWRLVTSDGNAPEVQRRLPDRAVITAAFADASRGAAVMQGGDVYTTEDGGRRWVRRDTGAQAGAALRLESGALVLDLVLGPPLELGARSEGGASAPSVSLARMPPEVRRALTRAEVELRLPSLRLGMPRLPDGRGAIADGDTIAVFDLDEGRRVEEREGALPSRMCELQPFGEHILADCPSELVLLAEGAPARTLTAPDAWHRFVTSDDGRHAGGHGACEDRRAAPGAVCIGDLVAGTFTTIDLGRGDAWAVGMHGTELLVRPPTTNAELAVVDARDGSVRPLGVDEPDTTRSVAHASLAPDGTVSAVVSYFEGAGERVDRLWIGPLRGPLMRLELPRGALVTAFADARRGVAAGAHLGHLWRTRDGARTWELLPLPADGRPEHRPLVRSVVAHRQYARCGESGCRIGPVVVQGWGEQISPSDERLLLPLEPAPEERRHASRSLSRRLRFADCQPEPSAARRLPRPPRGSASVLHGSVLLSVDRRGEDARFRWRDLAAGRTGDTGWVPAPGAEPPRSVRPVVATRRGVLLRVCATEYRCALVSARRGEASAPALPDGMAVRGAALEPVDALALADGTAMVLVDSVGRGPTDAMAVLRFDADARLAGHRTLSFHSRDDSLRALGYSEGVAGLFMADAIEPGWLRFYPLGEALDTGARSLPRITATGVAPCAGDPPTDPDVAFWVHGMPSLRLADGGFVSTVRGWVVGSGAELCVAHLEPWSEDRDDVGVAPWMSADAGALAGATWASGAWTGRRCQPR